MNDVMRLRELILGLAILSPIGCQDQPATSNTASQPQTSIAVPEPPKEAPDDDETTTQTEPPPAADAPPEVGEATTESSGKVHGSVQTAAAVMADKHALNLKPKRKRKPKPKPIKPRPRPIKGRLFYVEEQATQAKTQETRDWMGAGVEVPLGYSAEALARVAHEWLEDALEEHASIAAFSRATLELMALGAPSELLAEYQRASLEEIQHARACFALVAALTREDVSAGRIEVEGPREDLDVIIEDVFWGGCVGESIAALCAQRALRGCEWEAARAVLEEISEDEASHAALAWSTLSFLGEVEPERVRLMLSAVVPPQRSVDSGGEVDKAWAALGRLTPEQEARAEADAWEHLITPMLDSLLERS